MMNLPTEILITIIDYLEPEHIQKVCCANSRLYQITKDWLLYNKKIEYHKKIVIDMLSEHYNFLEDVNRNFINLLLGMQGVHFSA